MQTPVQTKILSPGRKLAILIILGVLIAAAVTSRMRWSANPQFLLWEVSGITYDQPFQIMCSSNILDGLESHTDNAAEQRYSSVLYALPAKLLSGVHDPYSIHRAVSSAFFFILLVGLALAVRAGNFSLPLGLFLLTFLGTHPMIISLLYQQKLVLTSAVWIALVFALAIFSLTGRQHGVSGRRFMVFYSVLAPLLALASYETYTGARVLGLSFWMFSLVVSLTGGWIPILAFCGATGLGLSIMKLLHPLAGLNLGIFAGRGEGPFTPTGDSKESLYQLFMQRLPECSGYFASIVRDTPIHFDSEGVGSHLDQLIFIAVILVLTLLQMHKESVRRALFEYRWIALLALGFLSASLLIPMFSPTFVRAHRQFGTYFSLAFVFAILCNAVLRSGKKMRVLLNSLLVCGSIYYAGMRIPAILEFRHTHLSVNAELIDNFYQLQNISRSLSAEPVRFIRVCDRFERPHSYTHWNSILYSSGIACQTSAERLELGCEKPQDSIPRLLISREGANSFSLERSPGKGEKDDQNSSKAESSKAIPNR